MAFNILRRLGVIVVYPTGDVSYQCVMDYFEALRAHPDWRPGLDRLVDNRNMIDISMTYAELRNVRANERPATTGQNRLPRTVFVCPTDLGYGMARMYQAIEQDPPHDEVHIVETYQEALDVLGVNYDDMLVFAPTPDATV